MKTILTALVLGFLLVAPAAADDEIKIERLFGPEIPGKYKHPASISEFDNGDLYAVYYGGDGEYEGDTAVYGSRLAKGSKEWTRPKIIADTPGRSEGNAAIWQAPDGIVWLFYITNYGPTWSTSRIKYKLSKDQGQTWTDSDMLAFELGSMVRGRPIVLADGDYLLPVYHETGEDRERTASDTCSFFFRYNPKTRTWTESNRIMSPNGNLQPAPAQITDDYLVAYCRPGGDFKPNPKRFVIRSESRDGGRTWSKGENSQFPNPNSAIDFIRLANGHLLLVNNDTNIGDRMPLTVAISTDGDKTYPHRRDIVNKPGDTAAYPVAIQSRDGKIHVIYTSQNRQVVNRATFDESAILGHTKVSEAKTGAGERHKLSKVDVEGMMQSLSNWGRWGKDDERGALNLITPETRKAAAALVKDGVTISLARTAVQTKEPNSPFKHRMTAMPTKAEATSSGDEYCVAYHGFTVTHMDALCHLFYKGQTYNGLPQSLISERGAAQLAVTNAREGIFARCVLMDMPRHFGVRFLKGGQAIYPEDLEACEKGAGVKVQSGDVVLIRTGSWKRMEVEGSWDILKSTAGLHASCLPWLKARDVAVVGSDLALDVLPSGVEGFEMPVHWTVVVAMGMPILDNCDLEALSEAAQARKRWEFLLTVAPLVVEGGTGSPVNPLATF
jgi:predicted neuraminidase/kynurenine formamidase